MRIASAVLLAVASAVVFGAAMVGIWACLDGLGTRAWTTGAVSGTVFGLGMGAFGVRSQRLLRRVVAIGASRDAFLSELTIYLATIGYHATAQVADAYTFRPSWRGGIANAPVVVLVGPIEATIVGPVRVVQTMVERLAYVYLPASHAYRA